MESELVAKMSDSEITRRVLKVWFIVQILIRVARSTSETEGSQASLICANVNDIRLINVASNESRVLFKGLKKAVGIDYDYAKNVVFWSDAQNNAIYSGSLFGGEVKELVSNLFIPDGLAVDWIHNTIYWTDKGLDSIGVARMDGSYVKTLFRNDLDQPLAISSNPLEGWMFWTDWGRVPKIERSGMDGTHRSVIVSQDIQWPNGLAIDLVLRKIFWTDAFFHKICSVDFDGSNKHVIISSYSYLNHPLAMDVFEDTMYWFEWRSGEECIYKANKTTGRDITKVVDGGVLIVLMGMRIHHPSKQPQAFTITSSIYEITYATDTTSEYPVYTSSADQNSSESTINPDVYNEESQRHNRDGTGVYGISIGVLCALALIALVGIFVYYRKYFRRGFGNTIFNNPVYRRHLEDEFCLEKIALSARESLEPSTTAVVKESA